MMKKKYLAIIIFLICILSIQTIEAEGNTANKEIISINNNHDSNLKTNIQYNDDLIDYNYEEKKCETDKNTTANEEPLTFTKLNETINDNSNSTIYLTNNYKYNNISDSNFQEGISINRNLTIYGNGVTLDGNKMARIFKVTNLNLNVKFYNINFINGRSNYGGAIYQANAYNCTFTNNTGYTGGGNNSGGAIYNGNAYNCTFIHNYAGYYGGAIRNGNAYNCTFTNNNTAQIGGAIYNGSAYNCIFLSNEAYEGGAICEGNAYNCTFTNNTGSHGGAIKNGNAYNCTFTNNTGVDGGAIRYGNAYNCKQHRNRWRSNTKRKRIQLHIHKQHRM